MWVTLLEVNPRGLRYRVSMPNLFFKLRVFLCPSVAAFHMNRYLSPRLTVETTRTATNALVLQVTDAIHGKVAEISVKNPGNGIISS